MQNTKSETIESNTGDPFWEKAEMVFLQSIIYYVIFNYEDKDKNFKTVLELIRLAEPDKDGNSTLGRMFERWAEKDPDNIGVKQWGHFKVSASSPKMIISRVLYPWRSFCACISVMKFRKASAAGCVSSMFSASSPAIVSTGKRVAYFVLILSNR